MTIEELTEATGKLSRKPRTQCLKLKTPPTPVIPEKALQKQIVEGLRWKKYIVLEVGASRSFHACPECGHKSRATGWQGNTPGTPDLFVSHPNFPMGVWVGIELKTDTGKPTPEQAELLKAKRIYLCRSFDDALACMIRAELEFRWDGDEKP